MQKNSENSKIYTHIISAQIYKIAICFIYQLFIFCKKWTLEIWLKVFPLLISSLANGPKVGMC